MTDNIAKITKILLWVLIALSLFFALMLFVNTSSTETTWIQNGLTFTYVLLFIAAGATVLASLYIFVMKFLAKPKKALVSLIPIILIGVVLLIAYLTASDAILDMPNYDGDANVPTQLKWSGVGLIMTYVLLGLTVVAILVSEIVKFFK